MQKDRKNNNMYKIKVTDKFSAAHRLLEYNGSCERLHGHTWKVELEIEGKKLDHLGLLIDFRIVKKYLKQIIDELDHQFLNEHPYFVKTNPTAENLAKFIYDKIKKSLELESLDKQYNKKNTIDYLLKSVSVWESENTVASYLES